MTIKAASSQDMRELARELRRECLLHDGCLEQHEAGNDAKLASLCAEQWCIDSHKDYLRWQAADALDQAAAQRKGWQPIETAPKDGSDILAFIDGFGMGQMVLCWTDGYWREKANFMGLKKEPTHWQPVPEPPALHPEGKSETSELEQAGAGGFK